MAVSSFCRDDVRGVANWSDMCHSHGQARSHLGGAPNIGACQNWINENLACQNPVASMTAHSGLNPRTFSRRFLAATGYLPVDYVQFIRIEEAKRLLETDPVSVEEIGHVVGYEDPTFFRRLFKRKAGLTPAAYRRKFSKMVALGVR